MRARMPRKHLVSAGLSIGASGEGSIGASVGARAGEREGGNNSLSSENCGLWGKGDGV